MAQWAIGIDIGGTFTDLVAQDHDSGGQYSLKVLTTHADPTRAVIDGVGRLMQSSAIAPADVKRVVHATTLFTNALIERRGARTGMLLTRGFMDIIEMGNERKYDLYDLQLDRAVPLAPRDLRGEVGGRLDATGAELEALDLDTALETVDRLVDAGIESLAICLLHAYLNDDHERRLADAIARKHPGLALTLSSETAPVIREYERMSTTLANAYIKPMAQQYLRTLAAGLGGLGLDADVLMMLSNGGLAHLDDARAQPIALLESGPAAGAISAAHHCLREGQRDLLAFDMGGTTAKLCLVEDARPAIAFGFEAARRKRFAEGSGMPINITTVDLIEIGAGGGSIAHRDELGLLKAGPRSAGSEPGPMCYGRGGDAPTVTDANLTLGYLNAGYFAGGTLAIDATLAEQGYDKLARELERDRTAVAWGVHDIVAENMAAAARVHVAERGRDPRHFILVATGGGGPLHAYYVARKIGVRTIICPPEAGVASAFGLLVAPARADRSRTVSFKPASDPIEKIEQAYAALEDNARASLQSLADTFGPIALKRRADGRFIGQGFNLTVDLPAGPYRHDDEAGEQAWRTALDQAFRSEYQRKFGRTPPDVPIELVNLRATAEAPPRQPFEPAPLPAGAVPAPHARRAVYFHEERRYFDTPIYRREQLAPGFTAAGPLLVEEASTTLVVGPLARVTLSVNGNLVVEIDAATGDEASRHRTSENEVSSSAAATNEAATSVSDVGGAGAAGSTGAAPQRAVAPAADPIFLEVFWTRVRSVVSEAAKLIVRTSFSTLSSEANDFAVVMTDSRGQTLAENAGAIPSFIGTLGKTVRATLARFPLDGMRDGDVYVTNNPWIGTGHLNDVCLVKPIFHDGRVIGFAATAGHVPDIGGKIRSVDARELYEEGFHMPLMHFLRAGEPDETLLTLLRTNVRTPEQTTGDIWCHVGATELIAGRVATLLGEYGLEGVDDLADALFDRSEQAMGKAITALPEGVYEYGMKTDGFAEPFHFQVAVRVANGEIECDFAGSSAQQPRAINCVLAYTEAMTQYAIKSLLVPELPNNHGLFRPVRTLAPAGSILNPITPAPVGGRSCTGHYVPTVVFGALFAALPGRVMAGVGSPVWITNMSGVRANGKPFATVLFYNGGMGATAGKDGANVMSWPSNISPTPIEVAERDSPLLFRYKKLVAGSGGDGAWRGGLGEEVCYVNRHPTPLAVVFLTERIRIAAPGLAGGGDGAPGAVLINGVAIDSRTPQVLQPGDEVTLRTPGGGGYGAPTDRDAEATARDARMGYTDA
ncbi:MULTISPECIES: hydantoinase B/oxoprolinase family protein [unclassified Achromobacter]|uniref:hydantoinase B/oxoprolinase family protein n=1 Tax=unclassified Achromobacter TaxID=2626865 RepID=UPI000B51A43F|nr:MULTISPECIES: hydantoinase B/oxoprolinase family protein [unclassified Achromobacter]OWT71543.1 methylhydantoinase [Achromobacter sp. HZ34]OWT73200.1 methylhydantoinase [Achromobacter sp. HZ28]